MQREDLNELALLLERASSNVRQAKRIADELLEDAGVRNRISVVRNDVKKIAELVGAYPDMRCHQGHTNPAGLWNCPDCTDPILDRVRDGELRGDDVSHLARIERTGHKVAGQDEAPIS